MSRSSLGPEDHVATVSVSFELAVDARKEISPQILCSLSLSLSLSPSLSLSLSLSSSAAEQAPDFHECHRNGERKRVYESPAPEHHFHLQYQLLPSSVSGCTGDEDGSGSEGGRRGGKVSKSDVVTFGVVSKVYTEQDVRVVRTWNEEEEEEEGEGQEREKGETEEEKEGEKRPKMRTHFGWRHK